MAIVEQKKSKSKSKTGGAKHHDAYKREVSRRRREVAAKARVPEGQRKSSQRYSSHLKPKKTRGSEERSYSRFGKETPKDWYVSNRKTKAPPADGTPSRKVKISAVTPRKAAIHALGLKGWGTNRAYVADGRGKGVLLGFVREKSEKSGRYLVRPIGKGFLVPIESGNHEYLSSSEGSEEKTYDVHAPRQKRKYVKSGLYVGKSTGKKTTGKSSGAGRKISEATWEAKAKQAAKAASSQAPDGHKRVAAAAAKEAVEEVMAQHPAKVTPAVAKKVASEAKKHAADSVIQQTENKDAAKAAGVAAQKAVTAAIAPRRSARLSAK